MSHEKDIHHGKAIVPYAPYASTPVLSWPMTHNLMVGWVLPGGNRTQSETVAQTVARNMAEVIG